MRRMREQDDGVGEPSRSRQKACSVIEQEVRNKSASLQQPTDPSRVLQVKGISKNGIWESRGGSQPDSGLSHAPSETRHESSREPTGQDTGC